MPRRKLRRLWHVAAACIIAIGRLKQNIVSLTDAEETLVRRVYDVHNASRGRAPARQALSALGILANEEDLADLARDAAIVPLKQFVDIVTSKKREHARQARRRARELARLDVCRLFEHPGKAGTVSADKMASALQDFGLDPSVARGDMAFEEFSVMVADLSPREEAAQDELARTYDDEIWGERGGAAAAAKRRGTVAGLDQPPPGTHRQMIGGIAFDFDDVEFNAVSKAPPRNPTARRRSLFNDFALPNKAPSLQPDASQRFGRHRPGGADVSFASSPGDHEAVGVDTPQGRRRVSGAFSTSLADYGFFGSPTSTVHPTSPGDGEAPTPPKAGFRSDEASPADVGAEAGAAAVAHDTTFPEVIRKMVLRGEDLPRTLRPISREAQRAVLTRMEADITHRAQSVLEHASHVRPPSAAMDLSPVPAFACLSPILAYRQLPSRPGSRQAARQHAIQSEGATRPAFEIRPLSQQPARKPAAFSRGASAAPRNAATAVALITAGPTSQAERPLQGKLRAWMRGGDYITGNVVPRA
jgi:hypothetical protein